MDLQKDFADLCSLLTAQGVVVDAVPPLLLKAHRALEDGVDKLYRSAAFTGDRDRAEHLFGLYEKLLAPLVAAAFQPARGPRKRT